METKPTITTNLIEDLKRREQLGIRRYGQPIRAGGSHELHWMLHAYEEALDLCVYLLAYLELNHPDKLEEWRHKESE